MYKSDCWCAIVPGTMAHPLHTTPLGVIVRYNHASKAIRMENPKVHGKKQTYTHN